MGHNGKSAFPLPSEVTSVAGAEGWEDMYPYFSRFRPEDDQKFWFYNSMHFPEPMPAFDAMSAEIAYMGLGAVTARVFAFPTVLGIEYRILNGRVYITSHAVTDPKKIEERLALFQDRAGHYYQNWSTLFGEWQTRMTNLIAQCAAIEVPELGEYEPAENVKAARGFAENHELREAWDRTFELYSKMWHHHFEFLMLGYGAYLVFFQFCKKAFPEIQDQSVARMVAGIDVLMFRPDDELKRLAAEAVKHGVDGKFVEGAKPDDILASLRQLGEPGKNWLAELERSREPWFNISSGDGFYHHQRSWNDDLSVPFAALPRYIRMIKAGESMDRPTEALKQERARIVSEYRSLLATDDDRGAFDQMLGLCHLVFPYVEDHKFYCEHWFVTTFYNKVREFGALLARNGVLDDAEDIFQLRHREADEALADLMLAWAAGIPCAGGQHLKPIVKRRREILKALEAWNAPPALGPMPDAVEDPAVQMLWGITSESLQRWSAPVEKGCENEVTGFAASPGVIEGVARVLKTAADIGQILDGEILVCPVTNPSWGPVFGRIKAAVSDIGGTMSHAAIVAREYGLPAVVGTGQATKRIATGQRLRVDGNRGIVTILGDEQGVTVSFVRAFSEIDLTDRPTVGGKGASLGELTRAGIAVPPGFVVCTEAFRQFLSAADPQDEISRSVAKLSGDDHAAISSASAGIRRRLESADMPAEIENTVIEAYERLGAGIVAVRSSATSEDSEEASFAGLQDTFLWLRDTASVLHHVRACWASLYSVESIAYRRRLNMSEDGLAMAVVVQRMVDAHTAGVMFTRSPASGDRSVIVLEGSYGLGSCIVSGEVTPDKFIVNKVTGDIIDRAISQKAMQHVPDREHGGVLERAVEESLQNEPCLTDAEIAALAAIGKNVERHYGKPQDIEWAISRDGGIYLLQSRPETVWSRRDATPVAKPGGSALDHVFAVFGGRAP